MGRIENEILGNMRRLANSIIADDFSSGEGDLLAEEFLKLDRVLCVQPEQRPDQWTPKSKQDLVFEMAVAGIRCVMLARPPHSLTDTGIEEVLDSCIKTVLDHDPVHVMLLNSSDHRAIYLRLCAAFLVRPEAK